MLLVESSASSPEHGMKLLHSIEGWEFIDQMNDYQLLKDFAPRVTGISSELTSLATHKYELS
jgi:hypothetical protein